MSDRLVGLIGPGKGPQVPTWYRSSVAKIAGLRPGGTVLVHTEGGVITKLDGDGVHAIPKSEYVQFEHEGDSKYLLCEVLRANAVP